MEIQKEILKSDLTYTEILKTMRDELQAEHTLISNRISWYVTSQSFLMAAFAVSLSTTFSNDSSQLYFFHNAIPFLGIIISVLIWLGVVAAASAQSKLQEIQEFIVNEYRVNKESAVAITQSNWQRIRVFSKAY